MIGIEAIAKLTDHYRRHKSQGRPIRFILPVNNERMICTIHSVVETPKGVEVILRRVIE